MNKLKGTLAVLAIALAVTAGMLIRPSGIYEAPPPPKSTPSISLEESTRGTATAPGPEEGDPLLDYPGLPYWYSLVPTGTICFEVRGSTYATQAALDLFYNTDAKVLPARSNCNGYPSTNHIRLAGQDLGTGACAVTGDVEGTGMVQMTVRGAKVWVRSAPAIYYNTNPALLQTCFGTAFKARHVYGHELLHAIGMKHNHCIASNVAAKPPSTCASGQDYSWKFSAATAWDRAEIARRY
jgi:hypothetical protein